MHNIHNNLSNLQQTKGNIVFIDGDGFVRPVDKNFFPQVSNLSKVSAPRDSVDV